MVKLPRVFASATLVDGAYVTEDRMTERESASTSAAPSPPLAPPSPAPRFLLRRVGVAFFTVLLTLSFVALATIRWDTWVGAAAVQSSDDAYVRSDLTHLSSRIAGEVVVVAVTDYQRVKAGDLLVQVDPADYEAQVAQAGATVGTAQAALVNLANQVELQYATIAQSEAERVSAEAHALEAKQEQDRQEALLQTNSGTFVALIGMPPNARFVPLPFGEWLGLRRPRLIKQASQK